MIAGAGTITLRVWHGLGHICRREFDAGMNLVHVFISAA